MIAASVGAAVVVAAGVFAIIRFTGDSADGGASSPEAAGLDLLAALENEDLLGVIDVLLPGERETMREPVTELVAELTRIEVLSDGADPSSVGGFDIVVEDEAVDVDETNVDDLALIRVTFEGTAEIDGEALPIGELILDTADVDRAELDVQAAPGTEVALPLVAVEEDGRWYVSAFHTVAELARQQATPESEIPAEGVAPVGAASPEEAVDGVIDALVALDLEGIIARLDPDEFAALQRYAPLFLDDAQDALDDALSGADLDVEVTGVDYDVSGDGRRREVIPTAFTIEVTGEDEMVTIELSDGCVRVEGGEQSVDSCELDVPDLDEVVEDPERVQELIDRVEQAFSDFDAPGIFVKEVDGEWYVSPMATGAEAVLSVLRALDREEIEGLQESLRESYEDLLGGTEFELPDLDDLPEGDDVPATTPTPPSGPPPSVPAPGSVPTSAGEACFAERAADVAAACFQDLLDAGELDPIMVPVYMRFPECGLAEAFWSGEYYSLADDEFVALVEPAVPCFATLLGSGELDESELPLELSDFECLAGRNWYTAMDDTDYSAALRDCAYG